MRARSLYVLRTLLTVLAPLLAGAGPAWADRTDFADGYLVQRVPRGEMLVVLVAGLAGEDTWRRFVTLMEADPALQRSDVLVYHSPAAFDIDQQAERLETVLREHGRHHARQAYIGHSIGGLIVKRMLLRRMAAQWRDAERPALVLTLGTPLDTDKFSISVFRRLGASVFWPLVPPLRREVFNIQRLEDISQAWRTALGSGALAGMRVVSVFGTDDEIAPAREERASESTVFIRGDHLSIATPKDAADCPYLILKTLLVEPQARLQSLSCIPR